MPLKHTVEEIVLKNGARGLLIDVPGSTAVRYDIGFHAGNIYVADRQRKSQTAHIMEHMAFGANEQFASSEAFSREFAKFGAYHNAFTSSIGMTYVADAPLMDWERILAMQLTAIAKPVYSEESLGAEKGNVFEELTGYKNDHGRILWQEMMRKAGLDRWYDAEEIATINAVTLDDIKAHHKSTHFTNNMRFILVGDLKEHKEKIISMLEAVDLPAGERLPIEKDTPQKAGSVSVYRPDQPSEIFNISFILNRQLNRKELRAMNALNNILTADLHSRIWGEARRRGICYGMGAGISVEPTGISEWSFGGQVSPENLAELTALIIDDLTLIAKDGVTQAQLDEVKRSRLGAMQMGTETVRSLSFWYGDEYFDNDRIDYVDDMPALIEGTKLDEITKLVREFLSSGLWGYGGTGAMADEVVVQHAAQFEKKLAKAVQ